MLSGVILFMLLVIAVLAIPISLSFQVTWRQRIRGNIRLRWLFGLVRIPITLPPASSPRPDKGADEHTGRASRPKRGHIPRLVTVIRNQPLRRRVVRFIGDLWRAIRKKNLFLHLRIGLDDPADTGRLWGIVGPLSAMLACYRDAVIEFEPAFYDETFELESHGDIRIIPLQILTLSIGLLLSPPVWRTIKQEREAK